MRDEGPGPMLRTDAVVALTASTSRKSSAAASGIVSFVHVVPPSSVRRTVPLAPLAQATRSLTALTPRRRAVTPLACASQRYTAGPVSATASTAAAVNVFIGRILP